MTNITRKQACGKPAKNFGPWYFGNGAARLHLLFLSQYVSAASLWLARRGIQTFRLRDPVPLPPRPRLPFCYRELLHPPNHARQVQLIVFITNWLFDVRLNSCIGALFGMTQQTLYIALFLFSFQILTLSRFTQLWKPKSWIMEPYLIWKFHFLTSCVLAFIAKPTEARHSEILEPRRLKLRSCRFRIYRIKFPKFVLVILMHLTMENLPLGQVISWYCQHKFLETKKYLDLNATRPRIFIWGSETFKAILNLW